MKPLARKQDLVVKELPDEVLIYDLAAHRAHCLNPTAAFVFMHCDGRRSVEDLARLLRRELDVPADERLVRLSLDRLGKADLLTERPAPPAVARYSRRELARRLGMAGALLPVVSSILAPTPAEAAGTCVTDCTGQGFGTPCYNSNAADCGIGCHCDGGVSCVLVADGFTSCP